MPRSSSRKMTFRNWSPFRAHEVPPKDGLFPWLHKWAIFQTNLNDPIQEGRIMEHDQLSTFSCDPEKTTKLRPSEKQDDDYKDMDAFSMQRIGSKPFEGTARWWQIGEKIQMMVIRKYHQRSRRAQSLCRLAIFDQCCYYCEERERKRTMKWVKEEYSLNNRIP